MTSVVQPFAQLLLLLLLMAVGASTIPTEISIMDLWGNITSPEEPPVTVNVQADEVGLLFEINDNCLYDGKRYFQRQNGELVPIENPLRQRCLCTNPDDKIDNNNNNNNKSAATDDEDPCKRYPEIGMRNIITAPSLCQSGQRADKLGRCRKILWVSKSYIYQLLSFTLTFNITL